MAPVAGFRCHNALTCEQHQQQHAVTCCLAAHTVLSCSCQPTNHLDAESVAWLERFLADFKGTVVAVTHDRWEERGHKCGVECSG